MNRAGATDIGRLIMFAYMAYVVQTCFIVTLNIASSSGHAEQRIHYESLGNLSLMIFIVDACVTRNIPQMKSYMVLMALVPVHFLAEHRVSENVYLIVAVSMKFAVVCTTIAVTYLFVRRFSKAYNWHLFKKMGASKHLKNALKTRKQLVLGFKILLVLRIRNVLTVHIKLLPSVYFYAANTLSILIYSLFLYSQNSESNTTRIFMIAMCVLDEICYVAILLAHRATLFTSRKM